MLLHDLLDGAARAHADRIAVRVEGDAVTYGELRRRSESLASWLTDSGVRRGDRVVVCAGVDIDVPALLYACSRAGAAFVVLRPQTPARTVAHVLDDAEPALLVASAAEARALAERRRIPHRSLEDVRAARDTRAANPIPGPLPVDAACLIYTSGSTGMPKAVVSTHQHATFAAGAIQSQLEYRADDVVYCALPFSFDYGLYQLFLCALSGAELRLADGDAAGGRLLVELREARATVLPAVPSLAASLVLLLRRSPSSHLPLRLLTNTGAAMPPSVIAQLRSHLPDLRVQLMFGLTECKRVAIMPKDEDVARPGACGRALPGTEVFAVDDDGARLPAGRVGELVVRGPHVMAGYWRRPELTATRFRRAEGLFPELHTGDYGYLDDDGYLYFVGRRDDLYKERGFRVSTTEVEAAAHRVAAIEAAAVVPPRDGDDGATLLAVSDLPAHRVLDELRAELEDVKVPARCVVVPSLPLNGNGKVDREGAARLARVGDG